MSTPAWTTATVVQAVDATRGIRSLRLAYGGPVRADPGSDIDVMVRIGDRTETRSYSVVTADNAGTIDLGIRLAPDGRGGSQYMHGLTEGDRLRVT